MTNQINGHLCPCCDKVCRNWWSLYNHLQLVHKWDNPPKRFTWVDRKCTKNPSNEEIQNYLNSIDERPQRKLK